MEPQVFGVLCYLAEHRDRLVTKEELLDNVWGDQFVSESALTTRIKQVRRAVGDDGRSQHTIKTVHGTGYRFVSPVSPASPASSTESEERLEAPTSLPLPLTPIVGRANDVQAVVGMLREHRLVTLTGVGGVGKTRLAVEVANALAREWSHGARWIELAPIFEAEVLPAAVATALGVSTDSDEHIVDSIAEAMSGQEVLIVLDNCEHLIGAAADLAHFVLGRADTVTILATSREDLRVEGERVWAVSPLDTSDGRQSAAAELFVQRAEALTAGYEVGQDLDVVVDICRRLDGIALAIELAAARTVSMSPQQIRNRLSDRFHLLSTTRTSVDRHQTLRQAISWSFDLLDEDERHLLQCCSVFADGFDAEAAIAVGGDRIDEVTGIDLLDSLARKSLLTVERIEGGVRFDMLETIRQYAADVLERSGSVDGANQRHGEYFAMLVQRAYIDWRGPRQPQAHAFFQAETANLRVAFVRAVERGDIEAAGRIAAHAAIVGWLLQRYEPAGWAGQLVEAAVEARIRELPRVLAGASLRMFTGRAPEAATYLEQAQACHSSAEFDPFEADLFLTLQGLSHAFNGRVDRWVEMAESLVDDPEAGHAARAALLWNLPVVDRAQEAQEIAEQVVAEAREVGNPMWIAWTLAGAGRAYAVTDPPRALAASRSATDYAGAMQLPFYVAINARELAALEVVHGDPDRGLTMYEAMLVDLQGAGATSHLSIAFVNLAAFFLRFDQPEVGATLFGAARQQEASVSMAIDVATTSDRLHKVLGPDRYVRCIATGESMSLDQAVELATEQIAAFRLSRLES